MSAPDRQPWANALGCAVWIAMTGLPLFAIIGWLLVSWWRS